MYPGNKHLNINKWYTRYLVSHGIKNTYRMSKGYIDDTMKICNDTCASTVSLLKWKMGYHLGREIWLELCGVYGNLSIMDGEALVETSILRVESRFIPIQFPPD